MLFIIALLQLIANFHMNSGGYSPQGQMKIYSIVIGGKNPNIFEQHTHSCKRLHWIALELPNH